MQGQWSSFKGLWTIDDDTRVLKVNYLGPPATTISLAF
jgi:hypothetical protein